MYLSYASVDCCVCGFYVSFVVYVYYVISFSLIVGFLAFLVFVIVLL